MNYAHAAEAQKLRELAGEPWSHGYAASRDDVTRGLERDEAVYRWMRLVATWAEAGFQLFADGRLEAIGD